MKNTNEKKEKQKRQLKNNDCCITCGALCKSICCSLKCADKAYKLGLFKFISFGTD